MKVGLIGINSINQEEHFKVIHSALQKSLSGLFSHSQEILPISSNYNVKHFHSTNDLFEKCDAIYFACSLKPNYDFAVNALKNSCHLFIEDISTLSIDEVKHLYKLAFEARVKIQLKLTKSFTPEYLEAQDYLNEPKFIVINKNNSKFIRLNDYFYEILNNLYFAHQSIQSGVKNFSSFVLPFDNSHFSLVYIQINYDNGAILNLKLNSISAENENFVDIHEKDRIIHINFENHFATKQKFLDGQITRKEFKIRIQEAFKNEISYFIESCQDFDVQSLSEFPTEIKLIKLAHEIKHKIIQSTHPL